MPDQENNPPAPPRFRIVAQGDVLHTRVYDDQGRDITHLVRAVTFSHRAGAMPTATLEVIAELDAIGTDGLIDATSLADTTRRYTLPQQ